MDGSNWDPLPNDITGPAWDLVVQLRYLLDLEGITLEQLAEDDRTPCSASTLQRIFAGEILPSRDLLKMLAKRCNADPRDLYEYYLRAEEADQETRRMAAEVRRTTPAGRIPGPVGRAARQDEQAEAEAEFWGPIGDADRWSDQFGDTLVGRMLGGGSDELREERKEERRERRDALRREQEIREAERSAVSRVRPTIIAVVLLASFAIGIVLATVAIGGPA